MAMASPETSAVQRQEGRRGDEWPDLPFARWRDTYATLQLDMQIIGKLRLALSPQTNQWWNVPFYLTGRGMTTSPMPYGDRTLECRFDFIDHNVSFETSDDQTRVLALVPRTVADFEREVFAILAALGIHVHIRDVPCEIANPIPFHEDIQHSAYDPRCAHDFWRVVSRMDTLFKRFRAGFRGKCSPVHFFWGSFDLAVTRFSGRRAPTNLEADVITRYAYDEEVSSLGFWPGDDSFPSAALYSYTLPEPPELARQRVRPDAAFYSDAKREFFLPYDDVRNAPDPAQAVLDFAESTYEAGATLAGWDRLALAYCPDGTGTGA